MVEFAKSDVRKKRVLLSEDDRMLLEIFRETLADSDFEVIVAENGAEALEVLDLFKFDLVATDLCMPGTDGLDLISHIRAKPEHCHLPILVITAHTETLAIEKICKSGANAYLCKPFMTDVLVQRVRQLTATQSLL